MARKAARTLGKTQLLGEAVLVGVGAQPRHDGAAGSGASAVNSAVARAAGLVAVTLLPSLAGISGTGYLEPAVFAAAMLISAAVCASGGLLAAATLRRQGPPANVQAALPTADCGLDAPPLLAEHPIR